MSTATVRATEHAPADAVASRRLVAVASLVAALALDVVAITAAPDAGHPPIGTAAFVVVAVWALAGCAACIRVPRLGRLVTLGAFVAAAASASSRLAHSSLPSGHGALRDVATIAGLLAIALAAHVVLSLPDGRLTRRSSQVGAGFWYLAALAVGAALAASGRALAQWPAAIAVAVVVCSLVPAVYAHYLDAPAAGRQRMQWVAAGAVLATTIALGVETLSLLVAWPPQIASVEVAATVFVPLGLLAAASPAVEWRIDRLLVQLLTLLGLTVVVAAVYLFVIRGLGKAPNGSSGRELLALSILSAVLVTVLGLPARASIVRVATGLIYGAREAPDEVVRTFGSRLTRAIPMDELLLQLTESLRKTLALQSAQIYTGTGEVLELAVSVPDMGAHSLIVSASERSVITRAGVSGNAWASVWLPAIFDGRPAGPIRVAPISHAGELLGIIVVRRAEGELNFREEDDRVLTEVARQVGLAFHNAQLDTALQTSLDELRRQADELRASRARIVASGDAERRRVERNLHDGAQQHLVALAVNLRLAKDVVTSDPEVAVEMLEELGVAVQETIRELRELAHGIYPPLLVDSGLTEALRAVTNRSPLDIELTTEGIGRYESDTEAAIYFCCLEALQNASKHAPKAHVTVRIREESGGLLFAVSDDGPGFDVRRAPRGHGFVNMMDRLGAIGGTVRWESAPGRGTTIHGSVPLT